MIHKSHVMKVGFVAIVVLVSACSPSGSDTATSSTIPAPVTTLAATEDPGSAPDTTTTTEEPKTILSAPEYKIVQRTPGTNSGDTVVVLLDPATYNSLTDIDLYDLIAEIVELFPPIASIHIVDSEAAASVISDPDASQADRNSVSPNYLARLENGFQITYLGPFASSGTAVLGS